MTPAARPKLDELLEGVRRALAPAERAIRSHRYLDALAAGEGEALSRLGGFAAAAGLGEQGLRAYEQARRAACLLQAHRLLDWDTLAEGL